MHVIPTDRAAWLTAAGEPLFPPTQAEAETPLPQAKSSVQAAKIPEPESTVVIGPSQAVVYAPSNVPAPAVVHTPPSIPSPAVVHTPVNVPAAAAVHAPAAALSQAEIFIPTETASPQEEEPDATLLPAVSRRPPSPPAEPLTPPLDLAPQFARAPIQGLMEVSTLDDKVVHDRKPGEPVHVQTQAEIAAALTEVLTHRMKPRRHPRQDLRVSTAGWLVLTGVAFACCLATLLTSMNYFQAVLVIGVLEIIIGYAWIVFLTSHRHPQRGIACAVPPLTFYYLAQWKYARHRPARFVLTGVVLIGLAFASSKLQPVTRAWVGEEPKKAVKPVDPEELSKLERMREYSKQKSYDKLIALLNVLKETDPQKSVDATDRPELAKEIKELCKHQDTGVRVAAMGAYARWGGEDAREVCLKALQSPSQEERMAALQLLPQWKGSGSSQELARAVAALIGRPGVESNKAEAALVEIGGVAAEQAAIGILTSRSEDLTVKLVILSILRRIGGRDSVSTLRSMADRSLDQAIKSEILDTIESIQARLKTQEQP
jgi:hypothetical protein